jgi:hypothetical protein
MWQATGPPFRLGLMQVKEAPNRAQVGNNLRAKMVALAVTFENAAQLAFRLLRLAGGRSQSPTQYPWWPTAHMSKPVSITSATKAGMSDLRIILTPQKQTQVATACKLAELEKSRYPSRDGAQVRQAT